MKKTIKNIAMAALCLVLSSRVGAQTAALKIGDSVPDLVITNVINSEQSGLKLSAYKNKLLILDFWATWCGTCIPSLIKLDSLQKLFKDEVVILPVTSQPASAVAPFLKKRSISLPSVTSDKLLKSYFPHNSVPHQVWVLDGKVQAITSHYSATAKNIKKVLLRGGQSRMVMKLDQTDFSSTSPLLAGGNGGNGKELIYQSMLTGYIDGLGYRNVLTSGQIMITNTSVEQLFRKAFEKQHPWTWLDNRVVLELGESVRNRIRLPQELAGEDRLRWLKENGYSFNLFIKNGMEVKAMSGIMQADLNRYFGIKQQIKGGIETRKVKCLVLTLNDPRLLTAPKPANAPAATKPLSSTDRPFSNFAEMLAFHYRLQPFPIIDETDYEGITSITLNLSPGRSLAELRAELERYGLELREQEREIPMLVLSSLSQSHSMNLKSNYHD